MEDLQTTLLDPSLQPLINILVRKGWCWKEESRGGRWEFTATHNDYSRSGIAINIKDMSAQEQSIYRRAAVATLLSHMIEKM